MGGIAKIKERILEEAQAEKQKLLEDARAQAQKIRAEYENKGEDLLKEIVNKAKNTAEEKKRRILSMAQLENRKSLLGAKQQIIDKVFEKAKTRLKDMPDKKYCDLVADMMIKSAITGDEEVVISEHDKRRITSEFLAKVNNALKDSGKHGNLRLSGTSGHMTGGFTLVSKDLEINNTFDSLIDMEREELETKIAKILFEE